MKKYLFPIAFFALAISATAQETQDEIVEITQKRPYEASKYNKWSVELNVGGNNAIYNFTPGYHDKKYLNPWHADLGVRYMFNTKMGLKADFGYDKIESHGNSKEFETTHLRFSLQGIVNLGRVLSFEDWTRSISLLAHAGPGWAIFKNDNIEKDDNMINLMAGLTAQVKLSNHFALTADVTAMNNFKMKYTWNGLSRSNKYLTATTVIPGQTVEGVEIPGQTITTQIKNPANDYLKHINPLLNVSLGLTYYIGGKEQHADWYLGDFSLEERIDNIEEMLKDDDNDGVPNYLDQEPNSAPNAIVDTRGRTIDSNGNGIPDDIEQYIADNCKCSSSEVLSDSNILRQLIDSGIINVYFDYNKSTPFDQSVGGVDFVVEYLKMNPQASVEVYGYADPVGGNAYNQRLSQQRADAVKNIIVGKGINSSRVIAKGQGEDAQFQGSAVSAHQLARRVVFKIK